MDAGHSWPRRESGDYLNFILVVSRLVLSNREQGVSVTEIPRRVPDTLIASHDALPHRETLGEDPTDHLARIWAVVRPRRTCSRTRHALAHVGRAGDRAPYGTNPTGS